jgi:hypothetical protein
VLHTASWACEPPKAARKGLQQDAAGWACDLRPGGAQRAFDLVLNACTVGLVLYFISIYIVIIEEAKILKNKRGKKGGLK